jgi:hypothetical protein
VIDAIIKITPFLNARIQGLYKIYREAGLEQARADASGEIGTKAKVAAAARALSRDVLMKGLMTAAASIIYSLYANNSEDDDGEKWFEKLTADDKNNYLHFYLGNNQILRIPKGFEVGFMLNTIPEVVTDLFIQENPQAAKVLWKGVMDQLQFDPLGNPITDTFREQISNRDSFTGMPIVEYSDKELDPIMQYSADTSAGAKAIAKLFNNLGLGDTWLSSPARVQNVIGNFLGSMMKYATAATNSIVEAVADVEGPTSRYATTPFFENVYNWALRDTKTMRNKNSEEFYELRNQTRALYASARTLRQEERLDALQNLLDRKAHWFDKYDLIEAVNTRLKEISRKRRKLIESRTLTRTELVEHDDELIAEQNRVLGVIDKILDEIEEGKVSERNMRDIRKRIENAAKDRNESQKAKRLLGQY